MHYLLLLRTDYFFIIIVVLYQEGYIVTLVAYYKGIHTVFWKTGDQIHCSNSRSDYDCCSDVRDSKNAVDMTLAYSVSAAMKDCKLNNNMMTAIKERSGGSLLLCILR
jgi:hypothetical protein